MSLSEFVYTVLLRSKPVRAQVNRALKTILPEFVTVHTAKIALNPDDPLVSGALTLRVYEREEIGFFREHFHPGMTLIDVGANVGLYTGMALATQGFSGKILCVEPDTESRKFLEKTITANCLPDHRPSVAVCPFAASDRSETVPFFRNPENHGDNRLYSDPLLRAAGEVQTETLDFLCEKHAITQIDFLKIDVQGAEARVIAGARRILEASPNVTLMTEFWPEGLRHCGSDPEEYLAQLDSLGFVVHESGGRLLEKSQRRALIARTSGRRYINLFGFKGSHAQQM